VSRFAVLHRRGPGEEAPGSQSEGLFEVGTRGGTSEEEPAGGRPVDETPARPSEEGRAGEPPVGAVPEEEAPKSQRQGRCSCEQGRGHSEGQGRGLRGASTLGDLLGDPRAPLRGAGSRVTQRSQSGILRGGAMMGPHQADEGEGVAPSGD
jgi:hypothetical protein